MKWLRILLVMLAITVMLTICTKADIAEEFGSEEAQQAMPSAAAEALEGWSVADADLNTGLSKLWSYASGKIREIAAEAAAPGIKIMAVVVLSAAADGMIGKKSGFDYVNLCSCLAAASVSVGDVNSIMAVSREAISAISGFSKVLLPTLSAAAAAAGAITSAPIKYAATMAFMDVLLNVGNELIFPLICAYLTAVFADAALGEGKLAGAVKLLKWVCKFTLTMLVTGFTAYLSVAGIVASSSDEAATKAVKTAISAALPVVGGIVSDAAGSIIAGAGVVRSTVGVFGLITILASCLMPFLTLGVRYIVFKAASAIAATITGDRLGRMIDGIGTACGMILGLLGTEVVFVFISIISMIKAVGG